MRESAAAQIITFTFALPAPVWLPESATFACQYDEAAPTPESPFLPIMGDAGFNVEELQEGLLTTWVRFSQAVLPISPASLQRAVIADRANMTLGEELFDAGAPSPLAIGLSEVTTHFKQELEDEEVAFERAYRALAQAVEGYRLGLGTKRQAHWLIPSLTLGSISAQVAHVRRYLEHGLPVVPHTQQWAETVGLDVMSFGPAQAGPREVAVVRGTLQMMSAGVPLAAWVDRTQRAFIAARQRHDWTDAVLNVAISVEVLVAEILSLLLWEDNVEPKAAAPKIIKPTWEQLKNYLPERLEVTADQWDTRQTGFAQDWNRDVAQLRNRVVHRGARATRSQAEQALSSAERLVDAVRQALMSAHRQYPRATRLWPGKGALIAAGAWNEAAEVSNKELHADTVAYREWRDSVDEENAAKQSH